MVVGQVDRARKLDKAWPEILVAFTFADAVLDLPERLVDFLQCPGFLFKAGAEKSIVFLYFLKDK